MFLMKTFMEISDEIIKTETTMQPLIHRKSLPVMASMALQYGFGRRTGLKLVTLLSSR